MAARTFALATALMLGLTGLAQAQGRPAGQEPGQARGANAPASPAPEPQPPVKPAEATPPQAQTTPRPRSEPPRADAARPRARADRHPRSYRAARYRGGSGASWKTGRDAYGFMGSYGGCSFSGHAGPEGYRLDRRC